MSAEADVKDALERVTAELPNGEHRPGQFEMALAIARAIENEEHLVVQAGTGTGKSLAYLVPTLLMRVRVVVVTTTNHVTRMIGSWRTGSRRIPAAA